MKIAIIFLVLFATVLAGTVPKPAGLNLKTQIKMVDKKIILNLPEGFSKELYAKMQSVKNVQDKEVTTAILNDYADQLFAQLQDTIIHSGLDPLEMPEVHNEFSFLLLPGSLDLVNGWLQDVSTIHRIGDVVGTHTTDPGVDFISLNIPTGFNDLEFIYDYSAKYMGLGPEGALEGKITGIELEIEVGFDYIANQASLDHFYILGTGHIDLNFSGNVLTDWILNLFVDIASAALHQVILLILEGFVRDPLQSLIDAINDYLNNSTTLAPSGLALNYVMS